MDYVLSVKNGKENLTIFVDGEPETIPTTHKNFNDIVCAVQNCEPDSYVLELVNQYKKIPLQLAQASERIRFVDGELLFDGDVIDNSLSRHIIRLAEDGEDDEFESFVNFMENLATNPSKLSRIHLFTWLKDRDFTLTLDGMIVGYKGVNYDRSSVSSGRNIVYVNGEANTGHIPNPDCAVVEIARKEVNPSRDQGCSTGLHVGTFDYAKNFASTVLKVLVNPRDVVAVPKDSSFQKMRVCRYVVDSVIGEKITRPVLLNEVEEEEWDEEDIWEDDTDDEDYGGW